MGFFCLFGPSNVAPVINSTINILLILDILQIRSGDISPCRLHEEYKNVKLLTDDARWTMDD